jgi:hypothetical protein
VPPGKTLFNCAFTEDLAAELMDEPDEVVIAALMAELRKLPLRGLDSIEKVVIHRWPARCRSSTQVSQGVAPVPPPLTAHRPAVLRGRLPGRAVH